MGFLIGAVKVIFLLGFLVFIHEGGHFAVAKLCGVKVKEFSLGFGPKLFSKKGQETLYSVRAIPLGGYVDMLGEVENVDERGSFSNSKVSHKIAIVAAGAIVNIVFGTLLYFILMCTAGINSTTVIKEIIPEYSSKQTVLQAGDEILKINGKRTRTKSAVDNILYQSTGKELQILINRNGQKLEVSVTPVELKYDDFSRYLLGVEVEIAERNWHNNLYYGFWDTAGFIGSMGDSLAMLFTGKVTPKQMTGPVGISQMVVKASGMYDFVYLMAMISLSLGVTNLLPIPALDGGKIAILLIEAIRKKKMEEEIELQIQSIGFTLLIMLSLYVTWNDIIRIFIS